MALMFPTLDEYYSLKDLLHLVLASLVHHMDALKNVLPPRHPLLLTPLFCNPKMASYLKSIVVLGYESDHMITTGIPPMTTMFKEMEKLKTQNDALHA
ncbi:Aste57867_20917 [Aphanomyces stellatus]|uniref:Aste57867_20917 protein n=1 Tax=Aphanomyces stellatus TaxID=120398 RepID=A0A485LGW8_9STRA|nr:hypothetical protein As57867_020849 [Aphanomyces stellatus]VFT97594.1 Aste57867_20917 [Aphanomyces stellatus]